MLERAISDGELADLSHAITVRLALLKSTANNNRQAQRDQDQGTDLFTIWIEERGKAMNELLALLPKGTLVKMDVEIPEAPATESTDTKYIDPDHLPEQLHLQLGTTPDRRRGVYPARTFQFFAHPPQTNPENPEQENITLQFGDLTEDTDRFTPVAFLIPKYNQQAAGFLKGYVIPLHSIKKIEIVRAKGNRATPVPKSR